MRKGKKGKSRLAETRKKQLKGIAIIIGMLLLSLGVIFALLYILFNIIS
ncbi:MAG: hypothetical protein ABSD68_01400 [Candidatus Micrarchaeales archaeon]|jgi:hypothetical protein